MWKVILLVHFNRYKECFGWAWHWKIMDHEFHLDKVGTTILRLRFHKIVFFKTPVKCFGYMWISSIPIPSYSFHMHFTPPVVKGKSISTILISCENSPLQKYGFFPHLSPCLMLNKLFGKSCLQTLPNIPFSSKRRFFPLLLRAGRTSPAWNLLQS